MRHIYLRVLIERVKQRLMSDNDYENSLSSSADDGQRRVVPNMDLRRAAILIMGMLRSEEEEVTGQVKELLKQHRDFIRSVVMTNVDGWTPFHAFCLRGCRKLLKLSLKAGVSVNMEMGQPEGVPGGCSALHLAAHRGDVSLIDILIQNGADVNKKDSSGKTPVYYASKAQNTLALKKLSRAGADMTMCDPEQKLSMDDSSSTTMNPFCFLPQVFRIGSKTPKKS